MNAATGDVPGHNSGHPPHTHHDNATTTTERTHLHSIQSPCTTHDNTDKPTHDHTPRYDNDDTTTTGSPEEYEDLKDDEDDETPSHKKDMTTDDKSGDKAPHDTPPTTQQRV